ncbi:MAG: hypothetical protein U0T82_12780 [Bacteroidales bacterium]
MKLTIYALLLLLFSVACKNNSSNLDNNTKIESNEIQNNSILENILYDINGDNITDTIQIFGNPLDAGEFTKIKFILSNGIKRTIKASDAWDRVDSLFLTNNRNLINSKRVFLYSKYGQQILLLFGYPYGAGRDELSLIRITINKIEQLEDDLFENVITIDDINNDSLIDIVGRSSGELLGIYDSINSYSTPYNPFQVYSIDIDCYFNKQLTKEYNEKNYIFDGYTYDENTIILCKRDNSEFKILSKKAVNTQ